MSTIGENRLAVYGLLYDYPIYNYINRDKNEVNVLILGDSWVCNEAFKAIFWCGQYPDVKMNITIASSNAENYKDALLEVLPGLKQFADFDGGHSSKYHYANVNIKNVSFDEIRDNGISEEIGGQTGLNICSQNYIIVAVEDGWVNQYLAETISEKVPTQSMINVFSEAVEHNSHKNINYVYDNHNHNQTVDYLIKYAKSINFFYTMKSNQNIANKKDCDREFDEEYESEFINSIVDSDDINVSMSNFVGTHYSADSSIANALHSKYKMHYCDYQTHEPDSMIKAINEKNSLYNTLISWEHRRWNAFMVTRGYRYPNEDEIQFLYSGKNDHRDNDRLLHICLCDCGSDGIVLSNHPECWNDSYDSNCLSELDRASILCNNILTKRTENISVKSIADNIRSLNVPESMKVPFSNFADSIEALQSDDSNSYKMYQLSLSKVRNAANESILQQIDNVNEKLQLLIKKTQKIDFFEYDAELINMLPVCESISKESLSIITVIENTVPTDILIPWMLFPKKAIFIFSSSFNDSSYQNRIKQFFESHGNQTEVLFYGVDTRNQNEIYKKIASLADEKSILNIAYNNSAPVLMAIGRFLESNAIISIDKNAKIKKYNNLFKLPAICQNKEMTVCDFFDLSGWESSNLFENKIPYRFCNQIEEFFYSNTKIWNTDIIKNIKEQKVTNGKYKYQVEKPQSEFLKLLENSGVISEFRQNNDTVTYKVDNDEAYHDFAKTEGILFELLVYYKLLNTGLFDDIRTGIKFCWSNEKVNNEIDEVGIFKSIPLFISCKTTIIKENNNSKDTTVEKYRGYIYEIASEANRFNGIGILAVPHDLNTVNDKERTIINRANAMGIALLDGHILRNGELLKKAIKMIADNKYRGPENFI